ncbi:unnamed protein product [Blepharisma stoltei]|uniref:PAS domain-containing protein n=1 Tax=Blepharisma stoltei TaxID=1481888 RepID=A0AAU9JTR7_9CILI|nr:unnamed protein product [Blepharisma stoltei]
MPKFNISPQEDVQFLENRELITVYPELNSKILAFFGSFFRAKYDQKISLKKQIIIEATVSIIIAVQSVSIIWYALMPISNWESYSVFWEVMGYTNLESICDAFNILDKCFYAVIINISFCALSVFSAGILNFYGRSLPESVMAISRKVFFMLTTVLYIPFLLVLLDTFTESSHLKESAGSTSENSGTSADFDSLGVALSIFFIVIFVFLNVISEFFTADLSHMHVEINLKARSHSSLDLLIWLFYAAECVIYYIGSRDYAVGSQIGILSLAVLLCWMLLADFAYFNSTASAIQLCKLVSLVVSLLSFLLAAAIDDSLITVLGYLVIQPFILINTFRKVKNQGPLKKTELKTINDFELSIRSLMIDPKLENKERIIDLFNRYFKCKSSQRNKLAYIWEINYCLHGLDDERLARIKLSRLNSVAQSLEGAIQEWKISEQLKKNIQESPQDIQYIQYVLDIEKTKNYDIDLCVGLVNLLTEFSRESPDVKKLITFISSVSDLAAKSKSSYEKIIDKYKNIEAFDLFISFLENVLRKFDDANAIRRKKNWLTEIGSIIKNDSAIKIFNKKVGIILISANPETMGLITHINDNASRYLKISKQEAIGSDLSDFVPYPYKINHRQHLLHFTSRCNDSNKEITPMFFVQDHQEYLFDCNIEIKYTALHYNSYFLVSLKPHHYSRQIILVSDEGFILGYSMKIPAIFGLSDRWTLNRSTIFDFVADYSEMSLNHTYYIFYKNKKLAVVRQNLHIKSVTIHIVMVISEPSHIEMLEQGYTLEQMFWAISNQGSEKEVSRENIMERVKILSSKHETDMDYSISTEKLDETQIATTEKWLKANKSDTKSNLSPSQSSTQSKSSILITNNFVSQIRRAVNVFRVVLLIAVLVMLGINFAILGVIYSNVSHSTSIQSFNDMGQALYCIASIANLVRSIDLEYRTGKYNLTRDTGYLEENMVSLSLLQKNLLDDYDDWSYCSASKIMTDNEIPIWNFASGTPILIYYNLYDAMQEFINYGRDLLLLIEEKNANYNQELYFLVLNSLSFGYHKIDHSLQELVDCEKNRIKDSGDNLRIIIICVILILGGIAAFLISCIVLIRRKYEMLWAYIRINAFNSYATLKASAIDRLSAIHEIILEDESRPNSSKLKEKPINTKILFRYSVRVFSLAALSLSFYLLTLFYLYVNCEEAMQNRPQLLYNFIERRTLLSQIGLFARDVNRPQMVRTFPNSYGLANPNIQLNYLIDRFAKSATQIRKHKYTSMLNNYLWDRYFERVANSAPILAFGTRAGQYSIIFDAYNLAAPNFTPADQMMADFLGNCSIVQEAIGKNYNLTDQSTIDVINAQLWNFIYVTIAYCVILALLYCFFYLPFLAKEIRLLYKIKKAAAIVADK